MASGQTLPGLISFGRAYDHESCDYQSWLDARLCLHEESEGKQSTERRSEL